MSGCSPSKKRQREDDEKVIIQCFQLDIDRLSHVIEMLQGVPDEHLQRAGLYVSTCKKAALFNQIKTLLHDQHRDRQSLDEGATTLKKLHNRLKAEKIVSNLASKTCDEKFLAHSKLMKEAEVLSEEVKNRLVTLSQSKKIDQRDTLFIHESGMKLAAMQEKMDTYDRLQDEKNKALSMLKFTQDEFDSCLKKKDEVMKNMTARGDEVRALCGISNKN